MCFRFDGFPTCSHFLLPKVVLQKLLWKARFAAAGVRPALCVHVRHPRGEAMSCFHESIPTCEADSNITQYNLCISLHQLYPYVLFILFLLSPCVLFFRMPCFCDVKPQLLHRFISHMVPSIALGCLCCLWTIGHQTWRTCVGAEETYFQRGHKDPASIIVIISDLISDVCWMCFRFAGTEP